VTDGQTEGAPATPSKPKPPEADHSGTIPAATVPSDVTEPMRTVTAIPTDDVLQGMKRDDLRTLAEGAGLEVDGNAKKEDIIDALQGAGLQEVAFTGTLDAKAFAEGRLTAAGAAVLVADGEYQIGTWSGLPNYGCPYCPFTAVKTDGTGDALIYDHISKTHPEEMA